MAKSKVTYHAQVVGRNLKNIRMRYGWSQTHLAEVLNITTQQVQKYEIGKNRIPLEHIHTLKTRLGITYEDFFVGLGEAEYKEEDAERIRAMSRSICRNVSDIRNYTLLKDIRDIIAILSPYA